MLMLPPEVGCIRKCTHFDCGGWFFDSVKISSTKQTNKTRLNFWRSKLMSILYICSLRTSQKTNCLILFREMNHVCYNCKESTQPSQSIPIEGLLETLIILRLGQDILHYGTRTFVTVFTKASHFSLSLARWIQSTSCHSLLEQFQYSVWIRKTN